MTIIKMIAIRETTKSQVAKITRFQMIGFFILLCLLFASCSKDDTEEKEEPITERTTGDTYKELSSPVVRNPKEEDHVTKWSCIYFGQYPTNEIVNEPFNAVDDYAVNEGDVLMDAALYDRLAKAEWTDDDTEIDGKRYHRINGLATVTCSKNREQHYRWKDPEAWHYFIYAPIKWRILNITGSKALLLADRMPDTCPFHDKAEDISWSGSLLREWLNGDFYERAFTQAEKDAIEMTDVANAPNYYFGTSCGPDTKDRVFILSESEVFSSSLAEDYGFYPGDGLDDSARRFKSTLYAKCRGAWWSPVEGYRGNSFWFMRSSGYTMSNVTYVCDFGYLYNRGTVVTCDDAAVLPAITIDLSKANYQEATPVYSTDINKHIN